MAQIYDSIRSSVTSDMVSRAADTLGESNAKVTSAISTIVPSLLGKIAATGDTQEMRDIISAASDCGLHTYVVRFFEDMVVVEGTNYGEEMENALLRSHKREFVSEVASKSGLAHGSAEKLTNWVAAAIAAYAGNWVGQGNGTYSEFLRELGKDKEHIKSNIPSNIYSTLGLSSALGAYNMNNSMNNKKNNNASKPIGAPSCAARNAGGKSTSSEPKKNNNWIWWALMLLLLLILCIFWWRSCNRNRVADNRVVNRTQVERRDVHTTANTREVREERREVRDARGERIELVLPDGNRIDAYRGGNEERLVKFIKSDDYKKASNNDLKKIWFVFDNIDFKHDSATELDRGGITQINNISTILKNYPDTKIMIGGLADHTGTRAVNEKISMERANFIKNQMVKNGVAANRISTDGFGEEFAMIAEGASDTERAPDRVIAMRLMK